MGCFLRAGQGSTLHTTAKKINKSLKLETIKIQHEVELLGFGCYFLKENLI